RTRGHAISIMMPPMASMKFSKLSILMCVVLAAACSGKSEAPAVSAPSPAAASSPAANAVTALQTSVLKPGTGAAIGGGQIAVVQNTGWFDEGGGTRPQG